MSNSWSMEDIISGTDKPKESARSDETAPKSTLQMLADAKPKDILVTPVTPLTSVTPETTVIPVTPLTPVKPVTNNTEESPVAPMRNFQKVSNAITKQAIPQGVFKSGKSKELYDVLYSLTRGAVNPSRKVKISKPKLQKLAGIGAPQTLNQGLMHLQIVGLLKIKPVEGGKHEGHEYEVFLYEESFKTTGVSPLTPVAPLINSAPLPPLESNSSYGGLNVENKGSLREDKTLDSKTSTKNDDETDALFSGFIEKFQAAAKKLTGAPLSKYEREKWERLADLLVLELESASRHASNPVSSVPAFLTKVLSSKLLNQKQPERTSKSKSAAKPDTVGKYYAELDGSDDEVKSLNDESKEAAVNFLREFKDDVEFLDGYKKWYTDEDWNWIIKQLDIDK